MTNKRELEIINFIKTNGESSSKEIFDNLGLDLSYATLKRVLTKLISEESIASIGKGKALNTLSHLLTNF